MNYYCSWCKKEHPESEFAPRNTGHGRRPVQRWCRKGMNEYGKEYRKELREAKALARGEKLDAVLRERRKKA